MDETPAYEREPYRTELHATVLSAALEGERPYAVLDDTILYPEGGGQPADRGTLDETPVLDVQKRGGETRHYVAAPVGHGPVTVRLDWARRFDHMQQHTGQHLLSAVAEDRLRWTTTAFHLGETTCDVELDAKSISPGERDALEEAIAAEIRAARPVRPRRVTQDEYASLTVRSRGLPEGFTGLVRLVEIAGVDLNTCGGTHLSSTAEIELVKLLGTEPVRGGTRLFFVAGARARRRFGEAETRAAALRALLGAPDAELVPALRAKLEQQGAADKRVRALEEELSRGAARELAASGRGVVDAHYDGRDMAFVQRVAREIAETAEGRLAFLTASAGGQHVFALAAGPRACVDLPPLGREIATLLGGKGGGSGPLFQGKAASLDAREKALERLAAALPAPSP